jgi:putative transposase
MKGSVRMITYKFRLYPSKEQQSKLWRHANALNRLYNYFLNQRIEAYAKDKTSISVYQQQKEVPQLRAQNEILKEIYSQVVHQVIWRLDRAYKSFFKHYKEGHGLPKFRSCRNFFGILYPQSGYSIENNKFITKAYGKISFVKHRDIQGNIKQVSIIEQDNKWFLIVVTDYEKPKQGTGMVGIDVGITNIATTSDGTIIKNQPHAKYFDKVINRLKSRRDTQTKRGSRRYKFLSKTIKRLYGVKERKTKDFLHKVSRDLSSKYDTIVIEDLSLKEMSESNKTGINRELRNSELATFISYLKYKAHNVIEVDPRNTSKTCNKCGKIHEQPLWKRTMECECGNKEDRDLNAAKNIYCLGRAILETGRTELNIQEALALGQG